MLSNETLLNTTTATVHDEEMHRTLIGFILVVSFIISGISLNIMYLIAYWRRSMPNTHFNYCMVHLSTANLLQLVAFFPYARVETNQLPGNTGNWFVESFLCATLRGLSIYWVGAITAGYMLCYMSSIKIVLIWKPLQRFKITKKRTGRIFSLLWFLAMIQVSPFWFSKKLNMSQSKCIREYHGIDSFFKIHNNGINLTGFICPLFISVLTYSILIHKIYRRQGDQATHQNSNRYRRKITILLGTLIAIFVSCWAPIMGYWASIATGLVEMDRRIYNYCLIPSLLAGTLNIACSMNSKKSIKKLFCPFQRRISQSSTRLDSTIIEGYATTNA